MLAQFVLGQAPAPAATVGWPTPPKFADSFYVGEQSNLAINQGGYNTDTGSCCSLSNSPQCKVQAISQGEDYREDAKNNRSRSDSAQGSIVNWYHPINKQMALLPGSAANSTHNWVCAQYCPTDGDEFFSEIMIGDGRKGFFDRPRDLGKATVTQSGAPGGATKTCEHWRWWDSILGIIKMEQHEFYVDNSVSPAAPFFSSTDITPFGGPSIGTENASFLTYTPTDVSDYFDIDPDSIKSCKQPQGGCNQNQKKQQAKKDQPLATLPQRVARRQNARRLLAGSLYSQAAKTAEKLISQSPDLLSTPRFKKDPPPPPNVTFGTDFSAEEDSVMLINQGGQLAPNGDVCCIHTQPGQCQVQSAHQKGTRFYDLTNQRERFEDSISGQVIVDIYGTTHKTLLLNKTSAGVEMCQEYCPIDPQDKMEAFDPFDPFDPIKDMGATTLEGRNVERYHWNDVILKVITMQQTDFYADVSTTPAAPVFMTTHLTPLGQDLGTQNQTWSSWTPGAVDAKKFAIQGIDTCPMSNQCQQSSLQLHRLRKRQLVTFSKYLDALEPVIGAHH